MKRRQYYGFYVFTKKHFVACFLFICKIFANCAKITHLLQTIAQPLLQETEIDASCYHSLQCSDVTFARDSKTHSDLHGDHNQYRKSVQTKRMREAYFVSKGPELAQAGQMGHKPIGSIPSTGINLSHPSVFIIKLHFSFFKTELKGLLFGILLLASIEPVSMAVVSQN